jgi:hypothetical protein
VATDERSKALRGVVLVLSWVRNILVKLRKPPTKKERPGLRKIAANLGVGVGTVRRINQELN